MSTSSIELNRAAFAENARVTARLTEVLDRVDRSHRALQAEISDQREEIRAQTQAVLRRLDRFNGGGATGPATA